MKQHREPFLFQTLEKYFQRDSAHHYKSTERQLDPIQYLNKDLQEKPPIQHKPRTTLEHPYNKVGSSP